MSQQRRQRRQRSQRRQRRQRGGDASTWTEAVYGQAGAQFAASPSSGNLIAANNLSGVNMCSGGVAANAAPVMGGSAPSTPMKSPSPFPSPINGGRRRRQQQGGKSVIMDVAVPAVLLYANQVIKPRKTVGKKHKKNFSRKFRRH